MLNKMNFVTRTHAHKHAHLIFCQRTLVPHSDGLDRDEFCHWDNSVRTFHLHQPLDLIPYTILANLDLKQSHSNRCFSEFVRSKAICLARIAILVDCFLDYFLDSLNYIHGSGLVQHKEHTAVCCHRNPSYTCRFHSNCS